MHTENKAIKEKALQVIREFIEVKQSYASEYTLIDSVLHLCHDGKDLDTDIPSYYEDTTEQLIQFFLNPEILNTFLSTFGKQGVQALSKYLFELQFFFTTLQEPVCRAQMYEAELKHRSPSEERIVHYTEWHSHLLEQQKALKQIHRKRYPD